MPPIRFFTDENTAQGIPGGERAPFQAGISNSDDGTIIEKGFTIPNLVDEAFSWLGYECTIETQLDAGVALHKPLPQAAQAGDSGGSIARDPTTVDTLASVYTSSSDFERSKAGGVNTVSNSKHTDVVQRMATSTYTFILRGWGMRAAFQVPIPGLRSVAGVPAIPGAIQTGYNRLLGNYNGVPVFFAEWELWYYVTLPPRSGELPPPNLALHIASDVKVPENAQVPFSFPDQNAAPQQQPQPQQFLFGK